MSTNAPKKESKRKNQRPLKANHLHTPDSLVNKKNSGPMRCLNNLWGTNETSLTSPMLNKSKVPVECTSTPVLAPTSRASTGGIQERYSPMTGVKRRVRQYEARLASESFSFDTPPFKSKRSHLTEETESLRSQRGNSDIYQTSREGKQRANEVFCQASLLPSFLSPSVRCTQTQTSPDLDESKQQTLGRGSGAKFVSTIKKTIGNIRRSFGTDSTAATPRAKSGTPQKRKSVEPQIPTQCTLMHVCSDGSYVIQLRRRSTNEPFGLFMKVDTKGIYVSKVEKINLPKEVDLLRVGDRVLDVQGVPDKSLDKEKVRDLLCGCQVATFRLMATFR